MKGPGHGSVCEPMALLYATSQCRPPLPQVLLYWRTISEFCGSLAAWANAKGVFVPGRDMN